MRGQILQAAAAAAFVAVGCSTMTGITPIPKSSDVKMGRSYAAEVEKQMPVEKDPATIEGCARVARKIIESNGLQKDYPWNVHVVRDDGTVNAFALPGGEIFVFTGLIARADDESELAGVLAHEITHVTHRHAAERMTDQYGVTILEKLLLGDRGTLANVAADTVTKVGFLHFSRSQESEADTVGLKYLSKTDYDPNGMTRFFEKIEALQGKRSSTVTRFLSDHPDPKDRVESTKKLIAKLPPERRTGKTYTEQWIAYRDHVCPRGASPQPEALPAPPPPPPSSAPPPR